MAAAFKLVGGCKEVIRNVVNVTIRPIVCSARYGTNQNDRSEGQKYPTRPRSAFIMFYTENLSKIKESTEGEIVRHVYPKKAGEMWRELPDEEREKYRKLSQDAYQSYNAGLSPEQIKQRQHDQWRKREKRRIKKTYQIAVAKHPLPKKPKSAMWMYGDTIELKKVGMLEKFQKMTSLWRQLPYTEKESFYAAHDEKMNQWREDFGLWVQNMLRDGYSDFLTTHELKQELRRLGMPKRPVTAFFLYIRASQMERGNTLPADFAKELASHWFEMSDEKKQVFFKEQMKEKERYLEDMMKWRASLNKEEVIFVEMAEKVLKGTAEKEQIAAAKLIAKKRKEKEKLAKQKQKEKLAKQKKKVKEE